MKFPFLFSVLLSILISGSIYAQVAIDWHKAYGGGSLESLGDIKATSDGGYIIAGSSGSVDGDVTGYHLGQKGDAWVMKISATGVIQWQKCYGGKKEDNGVAISETSDGGYILYANTQSLDGDVGCLHGTFSPDGWILKLDGNGNIIWKNCLGGTGNDTKYNEGLGSVHQTPDGGYIISGFTYSNDGDVKDYKGGMDAWIVKLTPSGAISWAKTYGGAGNDIAHSIIPVATGGYIFVGYTTSNTHDVIGLKGQTDVWMVRLNDTGKIVWQKCIGGTGHDDARSIIPTGDGGYAFIGQTSSKDGDIKYDKSGIGKLWMVKTDTLGEVLWERTVGGPGNERPSSLVERANGDIVVVGNALGDTIGDIPPSKGLEDVVMVSFDKKGTYLWTKMMGGVFRDLGYRILNTPDGGLIIAATTESNNGDTKGAGLHAPPGTIADIWLIKLKDDTTSSVAQFGKQAVSIYPTITSGLVHIDIPFTYKHASAEVLNLMGQRIQNVILFGGKESKVLLQDIPAGTYLLRVVCDGEITTRRILFKP